jgi:hypothetical protein
VSHVFAQTDDAGDDDAADEDEEDAGHVVDLQLTRPLGRRLGEVGAVPLAPVSGKEKLTLFKHLARNTFE